MTWATKLGYKIRLKVFSLPGSGVKVVEEVAVPLDFLAVLTLKLEDNQFLSECGK